MTEYCGDKNWDIMGDLTKGWLIGMLLGIPFGCFITWCLTYWYTFQAPMFVVLAVVGLLGWIVMVLNMLLYPYEEGHLSTEKQGDRKKGI